MSGRTLRRPAAKAEILAPPPTAGRAVFATAVLWCALLAVGLGLLASGWIVAEALRPKPGATMVLMALPLVAGPTLIAAATAVTLAAAWGGSQSRWERFVEDGLQALLPKPTRRVYTRVLDVAQEAHLLAQACSAPPAVKSRWTPRLLAGQVVELKYADAVSHETVRRVLKTS